MSIEIDVRTNVAFDDSTINDDDPDYDYWTQVCQDCATAHNIPVVDNSGSGICGVVGCNNEANYYYDFNAKNTKEEVGMDINDCIDYLENAYPFKDERVIMRIWDESVLGTMVMLADPDKDLDKDDVPALIQEILARDLICLEQGKCPDPDEVLEALLAVEGRKFNTSFDIAQHDWNKDRIYTGQWSWDHNKNMWVCHDLSSKERC
jgi:hypothetical protein